MNDTSKQVLIISSAIIVYTLLAFTVRYFTPQNNVTIIQQVTSSGAINTGSVDTGSTNTGSFSRTEYIKNLTGTGLSTLDAKINYVLSFGEEGNDFLTKKTQYQNIILYANDKESNNILIQSFIQKYQYTLNINSKRKGYLVVKTKEPVPSNKDMILAINGIRLGSFHKTMNLLKFKSDLSENSNDSSYIFSVHDIDIAQYPAHIDLTNYSNLNIAIAIGQNGNSVESISIVYID